MCSKTKTRICKMNPIQREFLTPQKRVFNIEDMEAWEKSKAYKDYMDFVLLLNEAVKGIPLDSECSVSDNTNKLLLLLSQLEEWINEIPPLLEPQRFGNKAYRDWYSKLKDGADDLLRCVLPEADYDAIPELNPYLTEGFGNSTRIDYGTGHELCFVMLICCLYKIGVLQPEDNVAIVNKIFDSYRKLVRKLQVTYRMEPAGSHGVWNLDDYHFLPFLWGSAQLIEHERLIPKTYLQEPICREFANRYMFMDCIKFINEVKRGPFVEHSNILWSISDLGSWETINKGLVKMYEKEVLKKFPIVQHIVFGSLLEFGPV